MVVHQILPALVSQSSADVPKKGRTGDPTPKTESSTGYALSVYHHVFSLLPCLPHFYPRGLMVMTSDDNLCFLVSGLEKSGFLSSLSNAR